MTPPTDNGRESKDYVLQTAKEHDVKFIRLWFTDILGTLKSVAITVEELPEALDEGIGFDGSSIEGFARIDESDMIAMPDPTTFALIQGLRQLLYGDGDALQGAEDVREPEADELDVVFLGYLEHVVLAFAAVVRGRCHWRPSLRPLRPL